MSDDGERKQLDTVTGDAPEPIQRSQAVTSLGWLCPRCGRANAPWAQTCPCVPPVIPQITC
jgi:hypothetical protein